MIFSKIEDDYALLANKIGDMLVMRVAHKLTGVVIYTKRKRAINDLQIKSELYSFREDMLERNGLKQAVLDYLAKSHGISTEGKDLRTILNEVKEQQDKKGYFDVTSDDIADIKDKVNNGTELSDVIKEKGLKKKAICK
ncbi:hypothetical protein D8M03_17150 [Lysinibacillus endophyticus]|uniref:Uncharacterized protein n=2 Tax=Ureibacillus endophyticus TaxID=1978490 RepID=A0A494YRR0_9BACL|nr:hypothetical protein D8M03_17150 [Lysinibacillus endophyticus]